MKSYDIGFSQSFDQVLEAQQRRVKQRLSPTGWTIETRGNQDRWQGRSVILLDETPDAIATRPGEKLVYFTGS